MENKVTMTSTRLSRIEGLLGVTDDLDVAPGYTVPGGLVTLTGQVQEMNRMLASLLDKENSTPSPRREGDVENSPLVRNLMGELEALKDKIDGGSGMSQMRLKVPDPNPLTVQEMQRLSKILFGTWSIISLPPMSGTRTK